MKRIRRSIIKNWYFDIEKEEKFLNDMSKKGFMLIDIKDNFYIFDKCDENEYSYKIDFLKEGTTPEEKQEYLNFIKEMDIDVVASIKRWQYFRKRTTDKDFEIYSDSQSKLDYYRRVNILKQTSSTSLVVPTIFILTLENSSIWIILVKILMVCLCGLSISRLFTVNKKIKELTNINIVNE